MAASLRSSLAGMAVVLAMVLALAPPALAEQASANLHGSLDGGQFYCGGKAVATPAIGGLWNLALSGRKAVVTMNVFYGGDHHTSFGWSGGAVTATRTGLEVTFGSSAFARIVGDEFTWTTPTDTDCTASGHDSVMFTGPVDR